MAARHSLFLVLFIATVIFFVYDAHGQAQCPAGNTTALPDASATVTKNTLKITSFNVYWLFDDIVRYKNYLPWKTSQEVSYHIGNVSQTIAALDADILNLVEVQDCGVMRKLANRIKQFSPQHEYESFLVEGRDTATGQDVALLARKELAQFVQPLRRNDDFSFQYPLNGTNHGLVSSFSSNCGYRPSRPQRSSLSKHYYTFFSYGDHDFLLFGLHMIAIPTDRTRCSQREAQAIVARDTLRRLVAQRKLETQKPLHVIVLGDFNDYDDAAPDRSGNVPNSQVFRLLSDWPASEGGLADDAGVNNGTFLRLTNAASLDTQKSRFTYWWDRVPTNNSVIEDDELSTLDHILVSPMLVNAIQVIHEHKNHYPNGDYWISDHWPISIIIDLDKLAQEDQTGNQDQGTTALTRTVLIVAGSGVIIVGILSASVMGIVLCFIARRKMQKATTDYSRQMDEAGPSIEDATELGDGLD